LSLTIVNYKSGQQRRQNTFIVEKKEFGNRNPTAVELQAVLQAKIGNLAGRSRKEKAAMTRGLAIVTTKALMYSSISNLKMVLEHYRTQPLYAIEADSDLKGMTVVDSHESDPWLAIMLFAYECTKVRFSFSKLPKHIILENINTYLRR